MEFFTTKIVDQIVGNKIDLEKLNRLFASSDLPKEYDQFKKVIVTLVAREPNDYEFESWVKDGKIYLTIPLVYDEVLKGSEEDVTQLCLQLFNEYKSRLHA